MEHRRLGGTVFRLRPPDSTFSTSGLRKEPSSGYFNVGFSGISVSTGWGGSSWAAGPDSAGAAYIINVATINRGTTYRTRGRGLSIIVFKPWLRLEQLLPEKRCSSYPGNRPVVGSCQTTCSLILDSASARRWVGGVHVGGAITRNCRR